MIRAILAPARTRSLLWLLLAAGCAPARVGEEPERPPPVGWRVGVAEHLGLWYHGLAYASRSAPEEDRAVLPRYAPGYVDDVVAAKRRLGVYPTPLDTRAEELQRLLAGVPDEGLEFLPLYFRDTEALFAAFALWEETGGEPRRAGSAEGARIVQFLSRLFPRAAHRQAVLTFVQALRDERQAFYAAHWQHRLPELQARAAAVQDAWDALAPALRDYLDYVQLENGELFLVPALSVEGRLVREGLPAARAATLEPPASRPRDAILVLIHEMIYPIARDAVRDNVAPARIRELGEERLTSLAAIRGGAFLLEEVAPAHADEYRRLYLRAVDRLPPDVDGDLADEFRAAFPLPDDLEEGLREAVNLALAGI